jgi:hypothetical protein
LAAGRGSGILKDRTCRVKGPRLVVVGSHIQIETSIVTKTGDSHLDVVHVNRDKLEEPNKQARNEQNIS